MALSNAWGLFQIIIFLGYGVINLPKHCRQMSRIEEKYEYSMFKVNVAEEAM
jgi:hypothetical protein